ncbi:MAG TPA: sugar ABC transporter ATP-binding protein [Chloroflexota bacterium]|nr:sugar ABC transporter ATP-binding protein [Chloroflexota bacterium]
MINSLFEWRKHPSRTPGPAPAHHGAGQARAWAAADPVDAPLLEVLRVRKSFAEAAGVASADLVVRRGEIHAIVGANGSGKTTLASIIAGVYTPDVGELRVAGTPVRFTSPRHAQQHGIVAIHQEPQFVPHLSVADNIFIGAELRYGRVPLLHRHQMREQAAALLRDLGATFDVSMPMGKLGLAERQLVAIARALSRNLTLCILDEPTAALGAFETERLFEVLRRLRAQGAGVIYISHQLDEVLTLADQVTIMRDGRTVQSIRVAEVTRESLISQFVGREGLSAQGNEAPATLPGRPIALQVEHLSRRNVFDDISFQVAAGEVYGLAGLTGSGRSGIARGIFGVDRLDKGLVRIYGRPVRIRSPRDAIKAGIGMLPEDRKLDGLILCQPANENVALPIWERIAHAGLVTPGLGLRLAAGLMAQLGTGVPQRACAVAGLSGGNQQKIVLAKWVATLPKVLILDEPTRGVDITAKAEIRALIRHIAAQGIGLLVICSELPELLNLADRVGVVRQGHIVAELTGTAATQEMVFQHALGNASGRPHIPEPMGVRGIQEQPPSWPMADANRWEKEPKQWQ